MLKGHLRMNPITYLRAAKLLFNSWRNRRHFQWGNNAEHFIECDGTPAYDRPALCGVMIGALGSATTQTSIVWCWDCAVALARDPDRWMPPPPRANWATYLGGETVCRSCGHYLDMPPGCSCPATLAQRVERFCAYQANVLKFQRLRANLDEAFRDYP